MIRGTRAPRRTKTPSQAVVPPVDPKEKLDTLIQLELFLYEIQETVKRDTGNHLALLSRVVDNELRLIRQKREAVIPELVREMRKALEADRQKLMKGDKGDSPTEEELINLIIPLIPDPLTGEKGDKGDAYVLTEKDKEDIARKVSVPVVEKVVERREVVREVPVDSTPAMKQIAIEETDKLEERITKRLDKDLEAMKTRIEATVRNIASKVMMKGGGGLAISVETPSGTVNASNTTFTVTAEPQYVVADGVTYFAGAGYTYSNLQITMDTPPIQSIRAII